MNQRKGITPVVAVTLLISITVAATGTLYYQIEGAQQAARGGTSDIFEQSRLTIEACNSNSARSILYVRNSNTMAINTSELSVYINSRPVSDSEYSFTPTVVDPQRDFRLRIDGRNLNRSQVVEIQGRNNQFTYRCLN
ncbi:hypothetical protein GKQ38_04335 [Candidatus Nanohaloarchaea archaeon]|nr:hypothetical protein GKQ38_04335 [Candidatus Nanohaloarchaea archaeon]